ncbi:hypothetical protein P4S72_29890 [Vibrio sp. PP-XX7]
MMKQRKWLIRCGQNGNESRKGVGHWPFVIRVLSALEWASKLTFYVTYGTGYACIAPYGKAFVADSDAGKGGRRKRRLHCNDADTDSCLVTKVTLHHR